MKYTGWCQNDFKVQGHPNQVVDHRRDDCHQQHCLHQAVGIDGDDLRIEVGVVDLDDQADEQHAENLELREYFYVV